jgi:hypothetical protein
MNPLIWNKLPIDLVKVITHFNNVLLISEFNKLAEKIAKRLKIDLLPYPSINTFRGECYYDALENYYKNGEYFNISLYCSFPEWIKRYSLYSRILVSIEIGIYPTVYRWMKLNYREVEFYKDLSSLEKYIKEIRNKDIKYICVIRHDS